MFYRCVANLFGYCSGTPDWETEPSMLEVKDAVRGMVKIPINGVCKNNWRECKKYKELSQIVESSVK